MSSRIKKVVLTVAAHKEKDYSGRANNNLQQQHNNNDRRRQHQRDLEAQNLFLQFFSLSFVSTEVTFFVQLTDAVVGQEIDFLEGGLGHCSYKAFCAI